MSKMEDELNEMYDNHDDLAMRHIDYDPTGNPNSTRAIEEAEREGLDVRFPTDHELLIDIDNDHSYELFEHQILIVKKFFSAVNVQVTPSRHGLPGRHIVVTMQRSVTELERITLQACLGSDRVREVLGFVQMMNGDPHPTLFLEAKAPAQF